jgi:hypothetical protein
MRFYWFVLGSLTVWRISYLLTSEDGPRHIFAALRRSLANRFQTEVMNCLYCTSMWVAVPLAWLIGVSMTERLLLWPALSGAAIVIEHVVHRDPPSPAAYYHEDEEEHDVLRQK